MKRVRLGYLDAGMRGWIFRTARKHYWRVARWYDLDDVVQDGYLKYCECVKRFRAEGPTPADDQRRFMAYFSTAFLNHITDLANAHTATPETIRSALEADQEDGGSSWIDERMAVLPEAGLVSLLVGAPKEIEDALVAIIRDGVTSGEFLRTQLRKKTLTSGAVRITKGAQWLRETTAEHFDRCLGRPGVYRALREYFGV